MRYLRSLCAVCLLISSSVCYAQKIELELGPFLPLNPPFLNVSTWRNTPSSTAFAVNNQAMIVGHSIVGWGCGADSSLIERECGSHAFSHTESDMVDLGTLGKKLTTRSMALAVNNNGMIVGNTDYTVEFPYRLTYTRGFVYTASEGMVALGHLGGRFSSAYDVNDHGMIVGQSTTADNDFRAFSYTEGGPMIDIGTLGGDDSIAYGVNDHGMIVGQSQTADGNIRAFSYTEGGPMIDIGTLGGDNSIAYAVNDHGMIVGQSTTADNHTRAFSYTEGGPMIDIGTLGGDYSIAYAVNAHGMIVGESETADGKVHAFAYMAGADMLDLGTSPLVDGTSSMAYGVNDAFLIVGHSIHRDPEGGGTRYFYLGQAFWAGVYVNEVPEPSTATLLFGALMGLLWSHRRKRHG